MKITLLEPFFEGSHAQWASGYQKYSRHKIELLTLPGRYWKWRMFGGAVRLAQLFSESNIQPDLFLGSDMLDLTTFQALTKERTHSVPFVSYFHENQITYPWSPTDPDPSLRRNNQYGFINFTTALASDALVFNSDFHRNAFLNALPHFLGQFPDFQNKQSIDTIANKSSTLHLGMDLRRIDSISPLPQKEGVATILWNHRWEFDKNPDLFFEILFRLNEEGIPFRLLVLGKAYKKSPPIFAKAKTVLREHIFHFGYADSYETYARCLHHADILPVTSVQDFFGGSVVEALYADCYPILPRRLAYVEHLPTKLQDIYFYKDKEELYARLRKALVELTVTRQQRFKHYVEKYDWRQIAPRYDAFFDKIVWTKKKADI